MRITAAGRATIRLAVIVLMTGALASVWELLALQAPGTLLYIHMLPGPISALRELAITLGLLLVAASAAMPWAGQERDEPRVVIALLYVGTVLALGAQLYGAANGMNGVQLGDLRRDALPLFVIKHGGLAMLVLGLLEIGRRVLVRPAPEPEGARLSMGGQGHALGASRARIQGHRGARQLDPEERGN